MLNQQRNNHMQDNILTQAIVLDRDQDLNDLDTFTSIDDAAAESLSKHKGDLSLGGLTTLSDAAAESLSKHKGELSLYGPTTLSDAAAESLSKHKGHLSLGDKVSAKVSRFRGK